jgi:AcrR family transcriptional regulator
VNVSVDASALPVREQGLRSRAGNAMARTRAAVLDGAARAVEKHGARRTTMADIANLAGIAKGTLYNHFRAKEAVFAAAIDAGMRSLTDECVTVATEDFADALALAAERLGSHPALCRLAADERSAIAALTAIDDSERWDAARASVKAILDAGGRDASPATVEVLLRWLVSFIGSPGREVEAQASVIARGLPVLSQPQLQF